MGAASASQGAASSRAIRTAQAASTRSTSSRSSRIRRSSRRCRWAKFPPSLRATKVSTIASFARWSIRPPRDEDRYILVRNGGTNTIGRMETYKIDMNTCLPTAKSEITDFGGQSHEFFLWHDPANSNRVLVYMTNWTSGLPDPDHPGLKTPDLTALAVTDEDTGEMLPKAKGARHLHAAGSGRPTGKREARRHRTVLRRAVPRFQQQ